MLTDQLYQFVVLIILTSCVEHQLLSIIGCTYVVLLVVHYMGRKVSDLHWYLTIKATFKPQYSFWFLVFQMCLLCGLHGFVTIVTAATFKIQNVASGLQLPLIGPSFTVTQKPKTHTKSTLHFFFYEASDWAMLDRNKSHIQTTEWFLLSRGPRPIYIIKTNNNYSTKAHNTYLTQKCQSL